MYDCLVVSSPYHRCRSVLDSLAMIQGIVSLSLNLQHRKRVRLFEKYEHRQAVSLREEPRWEASDGSMEGFGRKYVSEVGGWPYLRDGWGEMRGSVVCDSYDRWGCRWTNIPRFLPRTTLDPTLWKKWSR